jgi:dienelactone hydrolase
MRRLPIFLALIFFQVLPLAAQQPSTPFCADKSNVMFYLEPDGARHPVKTTAGWQKRREHILANMQLVMGPLPDAAKKVPLDLNVVEQIDLPKATRKKILYRPEKGDSVPAYLFLPKELKGRVPAMLCLHQTIAMGKGEPAGVSDRNDPYALELAEHGYVTIAPDYPNFGDYKCDPYAMGYTSATMKGIWNHIRAVDLLQSLPEVDPERIGAIGHSLGGHNSIFVAVFDPRIKAVVTSCGFNAFPKYYGGNLAGWSHRGYMPRIADRYGKDPKRMPFDFTELIAALAPRAFFTNLPLGDSNFEKSGVDDCMRAAAPVYDLFGARAKLVAVHPDCQHSFPPEIRQAAYRFLDKIFEHGH